MKKLSLLFLTIFSYNMAIAGLLSSIAWISTTETYFWHNFVCSQCIGFSIATFSALTYKWMKPGKLRWAVMALELPFSIALGLSLGFKLTGMSNQSHQSIWSSMLFGLFFGTIACITYVLVARIEILNRQVRERELQAVEQEKRAVEAQLKMLQAQIEPHFLFNTLANVSSLIDVDAALAKKLLERLNDWLRAALVRTRSEHTTLGDELDMLENYVQILKIRFGERLRWECEVADKVREVHFPPMLLQPLVENAVRHGIEPKIGGGAIQIQAQLDSKMLHITVTDSGVGLTTDKVENGAGLSNVRARLATLFGPAGQLTLQNQPQGGVIATLTFPQALPS